MIVTLSDLPKIRQEYQNIVLVGGCYDLLHVGHVAFLEKCKQYGDVLIVALSSDVRVTARKGEQRPIINEINRANLLNALKVVDFVLIAPDPSEIDIPPTRLVINRLKPDVFATNDQRFVNYSAELSTQGTEVVYIEPVPSDSTSDIISRICQRCELN